MSIVDSQSEHLENLYRQYQRLIDEIGEDIELATETEIAELERLRKEIDDLTEFLEGF